MNIVDIQPAEKTAAPPSGQKKAALPEQERRKKHGQAVGKTRREKAETSPRTKRFFPEQGTSPFSPTKNGNMPPLTAGKRPGTFRRAARSAEQPGLISGTRPAGERCPEQTGGSCGRSCGRPSRSMRALPGSARGRINAKEPQTYACGSYLLTGAQGETRTPTPFGATTSR